MLYTAMLLVPTITLAAPEVSLQIDARSLWALERLSAGKIESPAEAADYVRRASVICGIADPSSLPDHLESRLAHAELDAARAARLISDDQVAQAFNSISVRLRISNPRRIEAPDVLHYRSVMSTIFPHLFSPASARGSRPVGTVVMLYMLAYYGGATDGWKRVGGPNSFAITEARPPNDADTALGREYQSKARAYFDDSESQTRSFVSGVEDILGL
jgi:hypothetical protein